MQKTAREHPILHLERIIGNSELSRNGFEEVAGLVPGSRHLASNTTVKASTFVGTYHGSA
jgi:hypothetical protein